MTAAMFEAKAPGLKRPEKTSWPRHCWSNQSNTKRYSDGYLGLSGIEDPTDQTIEGEVGRCWLIAGKYMV